MRDMSMRKEALEEMLIDYERKKVCVVKEEDLEESSIDYYHI